MSSSRLATLSLAAVRTRLPGASRRSSPQGRRDRSRARARRPHDHLISDLDFALSGKLVDDPAAIQLFAAPRIGLRAPTLVGSAVPEPSLSGTLNHDLRLEINIEVRGGALVRSDVLSVGSMDASVTAEVEIPTVASAELSCRLQLAAPRIPIGGVLAFLATPRVPLGLGFDVTVELAAANPATFGVTGRMRAEGIWGTSFTPAGGVVDRTDVEITRKELDFTSDVPDDTRVEATIFAYAFAELTIGLTLVEQASLELLAVTAGLRENYDLDAPEDQGVDDEYASSHDMEVHIEVKAGSDIRRFLERFGFGAVTDFKLEHDLALFASPTGSFDCVDAPCIDAAFSQTPGVPVKLTLDPDSVDYAGAYIVTAVRFYSADNLFGTGYELIVEVVPDTEGQTEFEVMLPIIMEICRDVEAFVVTNRSPVPMEIAGRSTQRIAISPSLAGDVRDDCY